MAAAATEFRCFVGGLAWSTSDQGLEDAFSPFGQVIESKVINDRETGRSRGFGFVTFADEQSMMDAIENMNGKDLDGRNITVNQAQSRSSGGGGGGGGVMVVGGGVGGAMGVALAMVTGKGGMWEGLTEEGIMVGGIAAIGVGAAVVTVMGGGTAVAAAGMVAAAVGMVVEAADTVVVVVGVQTPALGGSDVGFFVSVRWF